ncbi:protein NDRG2-like [Sinocyclocheilus anshuiensis]|uniref:protein NDRG2-like n=1 Tax=Sinocyclocheilus anshuiensis TaxID=1608454 RepID=UPI0007B83993|nr:PREDICTED: protein NDRG2-like [Sinocyclocheilus anshuiensis]
MGPVRVKQRNEQSLRLVELYHDCYAVKDVEIAARILLDQGQEHRVETPLGVLHVMVHGAGNVRRPAILTFHDVGMDSKSCFSTLFKFEEMQEIVKNFTVVHVDAPGQEDGAAIYPAGYQYATMDQISDMLPAVLQYFNFRTVIGVGVGAGAYILSKFTLSNPEAVEGLVLINVDTNARGWMDWAAQKLSNLTSSLTDQILSHLFSQEELSANTELIQTHRARLSKAPNLINIELFWKSYQGRRDLDIERNNTFKCPVMLVVGDQAPYEEAAVECNSKLDPTTTSFLKMADAGGMPQLTQPSKLTEAFKYFIQGMGYKSSIPENCEELSANTELIQTHRARLSKAPNLINIELFWKSYQGRRDLDIERNNTFKCPVMLVVGDQAPYEEAAVECNSKLDPTTTSFLKMADAGGMPQLTQPSKLTEAFKYFIQGMGYMASSCMTRLSRSRTTSLSSSYSMEGSRSRSRTLSQGSQGGQLPPSPSHTMEVSC